LARRIAIELLVVAAVGLALAALGPFGSYGAPFGSLALFWMGSMLAGYAIVRPMIEVAGWLSEVAGIGPFPARLLAIGVAAVPLAFLVRFGSVRLGSAGDAPFALLYLQVWGIGLAMSLFMHRFLHRPVQAVQSPPPSAPDRDATDRQAPDAVTPGRVRPRFLDRLPGAIGSPLLCLSMEDHYVRAHGPQGSALILMRMRDAVAELDGLPGVQVHRSWWVANEAVERIEKEEGRVRLRLVNGMSVPVARSQLGIVRSQGWAGG
jgi:hypothetical protein